MPWLAGAAIVSWLMVSGGCSPDGPSESAHQGGSGGSGTDAGDARQESGGQGGGGGATVVVSAESEVGPTETSLATGGQWLRKVAGTDAGTGVLWNDSRALEVSSVDAVPAVAAIAPARIILGTSQLDDGLGSTRVKLLELSATN